MMLKQRHLYYVTGAERQFYHKELNTTLCCQPYSRSKAFVVHRGELVQDVDDGPDRTLCMH